MLPQGLFPLPQRPGLLFLLLLPLLPANGKATDGGFAALGPTLRPKDAGAVLPFHAGASANGPAHNPTHCRRRFPAIGPAHCGGHKRAFYRHG